MGSEGKHNTAFLVDKGRKDPNTTLSGPSSAHLNGVLPTCRRWPNIEFWLGSFVIFSGSGPILLGNPIFMIFQGGGGGKDPLSPSGSAHVLCLLLLP